MTAQAFNPEQGKVDLLREVVERMGWGRVRVQGTSMLPALRPGDEIVIEDRHGEIQVGELVAFQREGRLFVHRVIGQEGRQLLTRGDSVPQADAPVNKDELLGRVSQAEREGWPVDLKTSWLQRAASCLFGRSQVLVALYLKFASL